MSAAISPARCFLHSSVRPSARPLSRFCMSYGLMYYSPCKGNHFTPYRQTFSTKIPKNTFPSHTPQHYCRQRGRGDGRCFCVGKYRFLTWKTFFSDLKNIVFWLGKRCFLTQKTKWNAINDADILSESDWQACLLAVFVLSKRTSDGIGMEFVKGWGRIITSKQLKAKQLWTSNH